MTTTYITIALLGLVFIATGYLLWKKPPKKINNIYGYRTGRSMKNQRNWDHAQALSGPLMIRAALVATLISFVLAYGLKDALSELTLIFLATAVFVGAIGWSIQKVESELKSLED